MWELAEQFLDHAAIYYRHVDGQPTRHEANFRLALQVPVDLYGDVHCDEFRARRLIACRDEWIRRGLTRGTINQRVRLVVQVWRWGVEHELVSPDTLQSLVAVSPLKAGRCPAREGKGVRPVPLPLVYATLRHMPPAVADLCRVLVHTGMRWGEALRMRGAEIEQAQHDLLLYRPTRHKTAHHAVERVVPLGPRSMQVVAPRLARYGDGYLFRPVDTVDRPYHRDAARLAIYRACDAADLPRWSPGRIRHTVARELRAKYGLDVAQTILGHTSARTTERYASPSIDRAFNVMRLAG